EGRGLAARQQGPLHRGDQQRQHRLCQQQAWDEDDDEAAEGEDDAGAEFLEVVAEGHGGELFVGVALAGGARLSPAVAPSGFQIVGWHGVGALGRGWGGRRDGNPGRAADDRRYGASFPARRFPTEAPPPRIPIPKEGQWSRIRPDTPTPTARSLPRCGAIVMPCATCGRSTGGGLRPFCWPTSPARWIWRICCRMW